MRKLVWLVVIAAALWSGYWALAARGIERGLVHWLDLRRAEGWQAETASVSTAGFPLAFETEITDLLLVDPATGLGWEAPGFRFAADAHAPTRVEATWPESQRLVTPYERIDIIATVMRASLGLVPGPALALDTSEVTLDGLHLDSSAGWTAALETGRLSTVRAADDPLSHEISFSARNLRPARMILAGLDPRGRLPEEIAALDLDLRAAFDAPWDRHAVEDRRPQPTALDIRGLKARWGEMELEAAGAVQVDAAGVPDGKVTVRAVNWREMLAVAEAGGWIPEDLLPTVERGLGLLAGLSGNPQTIDAPLTLRGGFVTLGPVPLGRAPVLVNR